MSFQRGLLGRPATQSQHDADGANMARRVGLDAQIASMVGLGVAAGGGLAPPQPSRKKSFKDELQSDVDDWLVDVEI